MVTIKRYPNRRLYDTSKSQYINLDDVKQLIITKQDFEVVDSKTGADLTKSMLLQIITEAESNDSQSLLTNELLKQLICYYDSDLQPFLRQYMEQSLLAFIQQQGQLRNAMQTMVDNSPFGMMSKMFEQGLNDWQKKEK